MFGLFKKKSALEKLEEKHAKLLEEAYALSKSDRSASDAKTSEAAEIDKQIEAIRAKG
ncbi:MAG: Lacal_2735 family protein [Saprospiraceae bacterium]